MGCLGVEPCKFQRVKHQCFVTQDRPTVLAPRCRRERASSTSGRLHAQQSQVQHWSFTRMLEYCASIMELLRMADYNLHAHAALVPYASGMLSWSQRRLSAKAR